MSSPLIVVDGPNLYNDLGRYLTHEEPSSAPQEVQQSYYEDWFDIDRFVEATLGGHLDLDPWSGLGTVVFHSHRALGERKSPYAIDGGDTPKFWARQGRNPNTSTMLVQIDGGPDGKEKGVDTTIVVYLFETQGSWDAALIFATDTDYVPVVWSLRRKGKRVYCSSHPRNEPSQPLVQACQHFVPWRVGFLIADRAMFEALRPGGALDRLVASAPLHGRQVHIFDRPQCLAIGLRDDQFSHVEGMAAQEVFGTATGVRFDELGGGILGLFPQTSTPELVMAGVRRHRRLFSEADWFKLQ
jgi:hypothetical protein